MICDSQEGRRCEGGSPRSKIDQEGKFSKFKQIGKVERLLLHSRAS